mgnify:CR=1 FL=1
MKDRLDSALLRALLRKDRQERAAAFKKGNFNAVGFILRVLLTLALVAVFVVFFGKFLDIYLAVPAGGTADPTVRLYEVLSIVYSAVLIAMIIGAVSQINRALFSADHIKIMAALPVGAKTLYVSKLITIYLGQAVISFVCVLSVNITAAAHVPQGGTFYILTVLACLLLPMLSVGVASVLALPFHALKTALKDRFVLNFIVITLVTAALLFAYAWLLRGIKELLLGDDLRYFFNESVMSAIASFVSVLFPANCIAGLLLGKNVLAGSLAVVAALVVCSALSLFFIRFMLVRAMQSRILGGANAVRRKKALKKQRSPMAALIKKEFLMIFRTPNYMFSYFAVALVVPLMVYFCMSVGSSLAVRLIAVRCDLELAVFLTLLFGSLANVFCTTNISRDGAMFYSVKAMPVEPKTVIFSKVLLCLIVTALSQFLSAALLCATGYLSPLYALFLFAVGVLFGFAQICIATRIDFSYAKFSSEPDGEIKESGNTVSIMIVAGLAVSFLVGGAVVLARMYFSLRGLAGQYDFITFVIAGGVALVSAAVGCLFLMHNLKSRYYRFSGGWL